MAHQVKAGHIPMRVLARNTQQRGTEYEEQQAMISDRGPHHRQEGKHMMRLSLTSLHLLVCPVPTLLTLCLPTQHVDPSFQFLPLLPLHSMSPLPSPAQALTFSDQSTDPSDVNSSVPQRKHASHQSAN